MIIEYFKRYLFLYDLGLINAFLFAFIAAVFFTFIVKKIAVFFNIVDIPNQRKMHISPIPLLGGAAIFAAFFCALIFYNFNYSNTKILVLSSKLAAITIAALFIHIVGIIDDIKHLRPLVKLLCQIIAAAIVVFAGVRTDLFIHNIWINSALTIFWIVLITNSFNLLDNMDGLSSGIAVITSFIFFLIAINQGDYKLALLSLIVSGSALGFLIFNFQPASIFMGDGGSLFLGFIISVIAVDCSYLKFSLLNRLPVIIPFLVLFIPLYDTMSVIFIRRQLNISIFQADKRHFSHRLVNFGLKPRFAVLIIYMATISTGITATLLPKLTLIDAIIVIIHTIMVFGIIAILEWFGFKKNDNA